MAKVTARKFEGDNRYSWAVFIDGRPFVTGLTRREIPHYKEEAERYVGETQQMKLGEK